MGLLRPGNASSDSAADHIQTVQLALARHPHSVDARGVGVR